VEIFPSTIFRAKKILGLDKDQFLKFICCPKCNKLYNYSEATHIDRFGVKHSELCSNIRFPDHPQERMRASCNTALMKEVVTLNGKGKQFYPYKVYTFQPLKNSLQRLVNRDDILNNLRRPIIPKDNFHDVYEGALWRETLDCDGNHFFNDARNLGGLLNVDWFQPFSNSEHSVGVIYMVLQNLSRDIRFKPENVIIVGVIPGPNEPELVINSFLKPFVDELLLFWDGVYLNEKGRESLYRFALLGSSSDLPATRKCCGFLSFNALKGIKLESVNPLC